MEKILNIIFNVLKVIMLLVCFVLTFYIVVSNYQRLGKSVISAFPNLLSYILLFILFAINFILKQKEVLNNLLYNFICCFVFSLILFVIYRTLYDNNMVLYIRTGYDINFNYFLDIFSQIKMLLYLLCISNILMVTTKYLKKKNVNKG